MKRVDTDTRRTALMPRSMTWLLSTLAMVVVGVCPLQTFAQRPFPGMEAFEGSSVTPTPKPIKTVSTPIQQSSGGIRSLGYEEPADSATSRIQQVAGVSEARGEIRQVEFSVEEILDAPLADVIIEGNTTILPNAILRYIETRPGRSPSPRLIQQDVTRLLNTRWFLNVRPFYRQTEAGPVLVFEVRERPIIRSVKFIGNKKIKTGELEAQTGLRPGHGFDVSANMESVQRIKALYMERGHRFAEVTLEKGGDKNDRDVIFKIEEGHKVRIWDIDFAGNSFVTKAVLKTKLSSKTVKVWVIGGDYDPQVIRNDALTIKQYYMSLGFFDVEVDFEEKFYADNAKVKVTFKVKEGTRYRIGSIELAGNELLGRGQLLSKIELPPGDYYNARFLQKDVATMKDRYDDIGHMFASVDPTPRFREDQPGIVDLVYVIDEDTPRYWGQINIHIRGDHPHTKEELVRQQIHQFLKPGQLARARDYRMAQARVQGSQIWERSDPPTFNISPTEGLEYLPSLTARGQSVASQTPRQTVGRENLRETAGVYVARNPEKVFGHSMHPMQFKSRKPDATGHVSIPATATNAPLVQPMSQTVSPAGFTRPKSRHSLAEPVQQSSNDKRSEAVSDAATSAVISPDVVFRGQSPMIHYTQGLSAPPVYRGQPLDQFGQPVPQDYRQGVSPQGDPYGDALSAPPIPGFVDVNIDVTEGRTGRLMFGVGVNSDAGVVGSLTLQEDNFDILRGPRSFADIVNGQAWRGAGQSFRVEAVPGTDVSRYMVSWQDPYFLRSDFSLGVSGFYYNRFYRDWTEDRLGGRISLGYVLNRYWSVSSALRLENVQVRDFRVGAPFDITSVAGDNFLSTGSLTASFDTRDSSFNPTQGGFVDFTAEQAFGEFNYTKLEMSGGQYFTVYERPDGFGKHIFSLTGQLAGGTSDVPVFERYYAGGYSSFRGFEFRGVTPRKAGARIGGNFMALGTAEYMIPLTANDNIRAVLFSDFGTVEPDAGLDAFRATAGFGFRLIIPAMGPAPLAFDFAWPIMKQDEDDTRVFSFYVGFTK